MKSTIEWRSISEAKKDGTEYLLATGPGATAVAGFWCSDKNYWGETGWHYNDDSISWFSRHPLKGITLFAEFPVVPEEAS